MFTIYLLMFYVVSHVHCFCFCSMFMLLYILLICVHGPLMNFQYNKFYSILFYSILFYSILFYSILFYSILFYSISLPLPKLVFSSRCALWSNVILSSYLLYHYGKAYMCNTEGPNLNCLWQIPVDKKPVSNSSKSLNFSAIVLIN